jgi:hypothetical protein
MNTLTAILLVGEPSAIGLNLITSGEFCIAKTPKILMGP